ncbi:MAG: hypothetical protein KatS3mg109_0274 [Pirellulaceae bacterium]|nr:MAG: hypothetical protein KatS3mg109_0274 [Pirellulaceae bacterium]
MTRIVPRLGVRIDWKLRQLRRRANDKPLAERYQIPHRAGDLFNSRLPLIASVATTRACRAC